MDGYNGYANYQTWLVKLHIDNTENLYFFFRDAVKEINKNYYEPYSRIDALEQILKNWLEGIKPKTNNPVWTDLLTSAYTLIDCREIAECLLEDHKEELS